MKAKHCTKCGGEKPLTAFNFTSKLRGRRNSHCRECTKRASKIAYRKKRSYYIQENIRLKRARKKKLLLFLREYFSTNPCVDCGIDDSFVLQFDHVKGTKKMSIATIVSSGLSIDTFLIEVEKCEVRCANCHLRKTAGERAYYRHNIGLKQAQEQ